MKAFRPALFALLLAGCAAHQSPARRTPPPPISESAVRSHMEFLASDALAGRGSGTRDEWIAATYVAAQMRRFGLDPAGDDGFVQAITIERADAAAPPVLSFPGGRYVHGEHMLVVVMRSARASGPLHKFGGAGEDIAEGAVVLVPPDASAAATQRVQGAAVLLVVETPQVRRRWAAVGARLPTLPPQLAGAPPPASPRPTTIFLDETAHHALASLPDGTPVTFAAELEPSQTTHTWNAVGRLSGADPKLRTEVILLSAHLDHLGTRSAASGAAGADTVYNGADDDASGTVAVLELAQALAKGPKPKRTVVFALFGSEEAGGLGSRYFAERPPAPLTSIVANLQFEMIGRPDPAVAPQTLWLTGYERSDLGPTLAKHGARLVQDPHPEQNFFTRSDNYEFARRGIVAHTVSSYGMHTDYHQPSDEVDTIDFAHMTRAIASMLEPIRWLANAPFKPEWRPGMKP